MKRKKHEPNFVPNGKEICEFTHYRPPRFASLTNFAANIYLFKVKTVEKGVKYVQ